MGLANDQTSALGEEEPQRGDCPLIIFQSKADGLVDPKTESYVFDHVSSKQKKGLMFEPAPT
jgi:esterase/lipase